MKKTTETKLIVLLFVLITVGTIFILTSQHNSSKNDALELCASKGFNMVTSTVETSYVRCYKLVGNVKYDGAYLEKVNGKWYFT